MQFFKNVALPDPHDPFLFPVQNSQITYAFASTRLTTASSDGPAIEGFFSDEDLEASSPEPKRRPYAHSPFSSPKKSKPITPSTPVKTPLGTKIQKGHELARGAEGCVFNAFVHEVDKAPPTSPNAVIKKFLGPSKELRLVFNNPNSTLGYLTPLFQPTSTEIAYPYAEKGDLRNAIPKIIAQLKECTPEIRMLIILDIFDQILCALKDFHQDLQKVHCDLKPENILIFNTRTLKITDYGSIREKEARLGHEGWTEGYMPMDAHLDTGVSAATDIWSVGQVFHEILTGARYSDHQFPALFPELEPLLSHLIQPMLSPHKKDRASLSYFIEVTQTELKKLEFENPKAVLDAFWQQIN